MCQFNRTGLAMAFSAGAGLTQTVITNAPSSTTPFAQGTITGVTGANAGLTRAVAGFVSGSSVIVKVPFLPPITTGDQFQLLPGCDRTIATCTNVFNNAVHFGGFPYIPTPETAV